MLKVERISVVNMENAIRGARNPMNSWARMDSYYNELGEYVLGENDLALASKLAAAGSDHRKFLRQIFVSVDITAPLYWWKEFDTYKVATVSNSCSTMHKIHDKEFTLEDFSTDHLILDEDLTLYGCEWFSPRDIMKLVIETLNGARESYLKAKENGADGFTLKRYWWQMIQLLPSSYNQKPRSVVGHHEQG